VEAQKSGNIQQPRGQRASHRPTCGGECIGKASARDESRSQEIQRQRKFQQQLAIMLWS
jgi:ribosomal protein L19E